MLTISGYYIHEQLYESAHSIVYRGQREADAQPVILKLLKHDYPTPEELARFRREYEMTRSLDIDGVITVYALEAYKNSLVMVLEDFGGESLTRLLPERTLELEEFLRLAIRIAEILGAIHHQHIMHKDINPSNIVWNPETDQLKIIDFGISTELSREQPEIRNPNVLEGTLAYMSPEQTGRMNRAMDYRTDLYSLGVTFYEMLTGQRPFQAEDAMELVHCHIARMPVPLCDILLPTPDPSQEGNKEPPLQGIPLLGGVRGGYSPLEGGQGGVLQVLSDIIMKLLAKNAEDRYQSAFGLKADLEDMLKNLTGLQDLSGFTLAQHDISECFQIPQKLYGREQEIDTLLTAFDRVSSHSPLEEKHPPESPLEGGMGGVSEMILIAGYAGIGKSALVHEIHKPITEKRGYFITGKFDQFQRNIPYSALIQAFQGFMHQLLTEPEDQLARWKEKFLKVLGPNGQIIIDVIPDVKLIIGEQPDVPELPPNQAQNRFNFVFQNFVRTCAAEDHPLVIFLDDLQWADWASLKLLEIFMTDPRTQLMLIVGAYRDNEVSDAHPLMWTISEIQKAGAAVNTIMLTPLTLEQVNQLLADTLHMGKPTPDPSQEGNTHPCPSQEGNTHPCPSQEGNLLAELLLQKTGGNPFFLRQFLQTLYEEGLVKCDVNRGVWMWELDEIQKREMTDNVVELMAGKIQKLSKETQHVLKLAACIGNQFDLQTLSIVCEHSLAGTLQDLWNALQEELIAPLDDSYKYVGSGSSALRDDEIPSWEGQGRVNSHFKFLHDRIQQAAYSLIEERHKQEVHLKTGRLLLANTPETEQEDKIFDIVNHLNVGKHLIITQPEKDELAQFNLTAGRKAKASAAYQAAFTYLQSGIALLSAKSWQRQYDLTLALYVEATEATYLSGDFEKMEQLVEVVLQRASTLLDKMKVYEVKIQAYIAQNKLLDAIKTGLSILKQFGIKVPEKPTKFHILLSLMRTKFALTGKQVEDLMNLPKMTDQDKLAVTRILMSISSAAYIAVPELLPLVVFKLVNLSVKYGNTFESAASYAGYGLILCGIVGDIDSGYRFGKLALGMLEQFNVRESKARIIELVNTHIRHWKVHARETLSPLLEAYQSGLETGNLEYAAFSANIYSIYSYFVGKELTGLEKEMALYSEAINQIKQETILHHLSLYRQVVLNLTGVPGGLVGTPPWCLIGALYDEEQMLPLHQQANDRYAIFMLYFHKLHQCYLFQEYSQAVKNAVMAIRYLDSATGMISVPLFYFYDSLARLAIYPDTSKSEQKQILRKVAAHQKKMKKWAHHAPMNYLHKWSLVEAERARVLGKDAQAVTYYDNAIALAREHDYLNEEALALELIARFWLVKGKAEFAQLYMKKAHHAYQLWGAKRKVRDLEENYPQLLATPQKSSSDGPYPLTLTDTTLTETGSNVLDLATVMKASQTISGEIVLEKLLAKMMHIVLENAGAQQGFLMLEKEGTWEIAVESQEPTPGKDDTPLGGSRGVYPATIINYVIRTQEAVVLNDATQEGDFARDPYILEHQPTSVLCFPLLNQGKLTGMLYLENNLVTGAFTPDRLKLLNLLSSQMAIAIENAQLYANLEHKVKERTKALEVQQEKLRESEKRAQELREIAEAANQAKSEFLANMSHELRTPLNSILGYAQLFKRDRDLTEKQRGAIETIHRSGEHLLLLINDLLDLSKIEARKIELKPANISLTGFLKSIVEIARIQAQQKGITFRCDIASDLPVVQVDEKRLRQILLNLLNNAIKFTEKGSVILRIANCKMQNEPTPHPSQEGKFEIRNLKFEIEDTGIGIPLEHLQDIFLPFHQISNAQTGREGTGLGLAISRQLTRIMGTELQVKSTVGQGTTFWFDLQVPVIDGLHLEGGVHLERIIGFKGDKQKILLVDDKARNRGLLRDTLLPLGFEVLEAADGREALNKLVIASEAKQSLPNLIFMDLVMPVMDGFEATRQIRRLPELKDVIVIGISASALEATKQASVAAGCHDFLTKPIQIDELLDCLRLHLGIEWIYEDAAETDSRNRETAATFPLVAPPQEILMKLLEFAKDGHITDIRKLIADLKGSDPSLIPFARRIEQLADNFQFDQIIEWTTSYNNKT